MNFTEYLDPVSKSFEDNSLYIKKMGEVITKHFSPSHFPDINKTQIAIIGVPEERQAINNKGCSKAPDAVRKYLYDLFPCSATVNITDLGNIKPGHTPKDTFFALSVVLTKLIESNILPIIIGGSQDLTYACYHAYENLARVVNIVAVDNTFDLGDENENLCSKSFLSHIIMHQPSYLFNYTNLAYQTYLVDQDAIKLMKQLYFDIYRLGMVRANIQEVEPIVRNADMLSFDLSAIRFADAPGNGNASPNGLYGDEACQIARYAGVSNKLTCCGFYEINPELDNRGQTAHLAAQMIWYIIEGFYSRSEDNPSRDKAQFLKYTVTMEDHVDDIIFYKSRKSDRWWMELPCPEHLQKRLHEHLMIPCSYNDYQTALQNEIPDRWWQAFQKIM